MGHPSYGALPCPSILHCWVPVHHLLSLCLCLSLSLSVSVCVCVCVCVCVWSVLRWSPGSHACYASTFPLNYTQATPYYLLNPSLLAFLHLFPLIEVTVIVKYFQHFFSPQIQYTTKWVFCFLLSLLVRWQMTLLLYNVFALSEFFFNDKPMLLF
jgi:hypothetical protein